MNIKPFNCSLVPDIRFGCGLLEESVDIIYSFGRRVLLILGGNSFRESRYYSILIDALSKREIEISEVSVTGEPTPDLIDRSTDQYRYRGIDVVVAIGGGSVLDAGKAISAMLTRPDSIENYLEGVGTKNHPGTKVSFIAIPTTAGTGSEATKNAVISQIGFYKKSLRHNSFIPDLAIVDPLLTLSCPKDVTAACGLDALAHLLGGYLSTNSSSYTDVLALDGIKAVRDGLIKSYEEPDNIEARTNMAYASMLSGIVLTNAGLGVLHGMASAIGTVVNIPHGVVCGALLGEVLEKNIIELQKIGEDGVLALNKYSMVSSILSGGMILPDSGGLEYLVTTVKRWIKAMNIKGLSEYGIRDKDLPIIVEKSSFKSNPVELSGEDMLNILKKCL